jgi:ribosomal-protein-alanine N-acetyltransferase
MLETLRLSVRPFVDSDFDRLFTLRRDKEVGRYLGGSDVPAERVAARMRYYMDHYARWGYAMGVVSLKTSPGMIGFGGLQHFDDKDEVEVGYALDRAYWGQGLATELASGWLRYGFDTLGLDRIVAVAIPENLASRRVMEKLGMRYEKHVMHYGSECVYYAVTRAQFVAGLQ